MENQEYCEVIKNKITKQTKYFQKSNKKRYIKSEETAPF